MYLLESCFVFFRPVSLVGRRIHCISWAIPLALLYNIFVLFWNLINHFFEKKKTVRFWYVGFLDFWQFWVGIKFVHNFKGRPTDFWLVWLIFDLTIFMITHNWIKRVMLWYQNYIPKMNLKWYDSETALNTLGLFEFWLIVN